MKNRYIKYDIFVEALIVAILGTTPGMDHDYFISNTLGKEVPEGEHYSETFTSPYMNLEFALECALPAFINARRLGTLFLKSPHLQMENIEDLFKRHRRVNVELTLHDALRIMTNDTATQSAAINSVFTLGQG